MPSTAPALTPEERAAALAKAAQARIARAALKNEIKEGKVSAIAVLDMEGDIAQRMKVKDLIMAVPGLGEAKATKLMEEIGISESRRIQGLGVKQREALVKALDR